jgi:hypothetical protein
MGYRTRILNDRDDIVPGEVGDDIGDGCRRYGIQIGCSLAERRPCLLICWRYCLRRKSFADSGLQRLLGRRTSVP